MQKHLCWKPLKLIFSDSVFESLANDKYAWVGSEKAKVLLLNDFRWSKDLIHWYDMLFLLEGETVTLPAPKNIYSKDIVISTSVVILQQARVQSRTEAITMQVMTGRQRRWLPDRKTMSFTISFLQKSKKLKIFCKMSIFWLKAYNFYFYKNF